ncbi:MAG: hypothetical protein KF726_22970 [Anaerolineae bacterium]|nr:hypothetical protein [Anaerolineae bacterium]
MLIDDFCCNSHEQPEDPCKEEYVYHYGLCQKDGVGDTWKKQDCVNSDLKIPTRAVNFRLRYGSHLKYPNQHATLEIGTMTSNDPHPDRGDDRTCGLVVGCGYGLLYMLDIVYDVANANPDYMDFSGDSQFLLEYETVSLDIECSVFCYCPAVSPRQYVAFAPTGAHPSIVPRQPYVRQLRFADFQTGDPGDPLFFGGAGSPSSRVQRLTIEIFHNYGGGDFKLSSVRSAR